jgi:hypothetical protein
LASSANGPSLSTCTLSSTQVSKGSGDTHVTFTIATTAPVIARVHPGGALRSLMYALWLSFPGLFIVFRALELRRWRRLRFAIFLFLIVLALWLEIACSSGLQGNGTGGNGQAGTPSGTYTMTVTATASGLPERSVQLQLTVN